jgi:hypothetical protein
MCLAAVALSAGAAPLPRPTITIGRCATAPTVDGVVARGEWDQAAAGGGFRTFGTQDLLSIQPTFRLMFDETALYLAVVVPRTAGIRLSAKHRTRDSAVYTDDSVEFLIDPGLTRSRCFQFVVNSLGTVYDAQDRSSTWNAAGARVSAAVGDDQWAFELAVPWVDLPMEPPANGTVMGLNLGLNYGSHGKLTGTWADVENGFRDARNFGRITLSKTDPGVSVSGFDALVAGQGALVLNRPGTVPVELELRIWPRGKEGAPCIALQRTALGVSTIPVQLPEPSLQEGTVAYDGEIIVRDERRVLWSLAFGTRLPPMVTLGINALPDTKQVEVELTAGPRIAHPERCSASVTIGSPGGDEAKTHVLPRLTPGKPVTAIFAGEDIPPGDVTATVRIMGADGANIFTTTRSLGNLLAPWWFEDSTGRQETIPPPYQPLRTEHTTVFSWNRSYRFGNCLLPTAVTTADASVLAGPIVLQARAGAQRLEWQGSEPTITSAGPGKVELTTRAQCPGLKLSGTAVVEFDGMIKVDLELLPAGPQQVDSLTIEIPLKPEHAEYLYHFPGKWRSVANSGRLPTEGFCHAFKPFVWLGDNDRGFAWFCESAENWLPEDRDDALTIDREDGRVVMRLHLVDGEPITEPLTYTFGFQATPVKKPQKTVWDYRISHAGAFGIQNRPAVPAPADIAYPAATSIKGDQGTAEMWIAPAVDSDPKLAGTMTPDQAPNVTLFWLDVAKDTNAGLFWCGPAQELRIWVRVAGKVLTTLSLPVAWRAGDPHHVAFSWGDELRIYLDGELKVRKPYVGLMPVDLSEASLWVGKGAPPLWVDEIRTSAVPRPPDLSAQPYRPDADTLLLDHLDRTAPGFQSVTEPEAGAKGQIRGPLEPIPGRHGKALRLRGDTKGYTVLDQLAEAGVKTLCFHSQWSWMGYPMPRPGQEQDLRDLVRACHAKGIQLLLYASPLTADQAPEWELYHKYFLIEPLKWPYRYDGGHLAPACCWQSRYRNLWLARQAKLIEEYDIDGFYLDGSEWPLDCRNEHHGCGYRRRDGTIGTTCNIFGTRDYMKRLYALCKSRKPDAQINIHNSTVMVIPTLGWGTSSWGGEQLGSLSWDKGGAVEKRDYALDALPLDAFRTEFMGRQWGVPSEFLCYERPYTTPQVLAVTLLHHVLVRPNAAHLPQISAIWGLYDSFGMKDAIWQPYWANSALLTPENETTKVSAYQHSRNGLLMVVANLSVEERTARVRLDLPGLGFVTSPREARDPLAGQPVHLSGNHVALKLAPFSFRYVHVR